MTTVRPLPVPVGARVAELLPALEAALAGGAPVAPYDAAQPAPSLPGPDRLPEGLALCVGTSGSTGGSSARCSPATTSSRR